MLPYLHINTLSQHIKKLLYECICKIPLLRMLVMGGPVVLGEIIIQIGAFSSSVDDEISLVGTVPHPVKSHC